VARDLLNSTLSAWTIGLGLCLAEVCVCAAEAQSSWGQSAPTTARPSMLESIGSTIEKGMEKLAETVAPKTSVKPADDPVALRTKATPSAELFVRVAHLYEGSGRLKEAAAQYEKALGITPDYLGALLGYARLKDFLGQPDEAIKLYQRAAGAYPREAAVYNNLALFYARRRMLDRSTAMLGRAIQLEPSNAKYRNNMATVLVEMGRIEEAFRQLQSVHPEAVAYYNLGFLLEKRGDPEAAARHFAVALQRDPSLIQASRGLQRLAAARTANRPVEEPPTGPRLGHRPMRPDRSAEGPALGGSGSGARQLPPVSPRPRRLPPVMRGGVSEPPSAPLPSGAPSPPPAAGPQPIPDAPLPGATIDDRVARPMRRAF